jgi:hypothetical protein
MIRIATFKSPEEENYQDFEKRYDQYTKRLIRNTTITWLTTTTILLLLITTNKL